MSPGSGPARRVAVVGAGGHGKVVFSVLQAIGITAHGFYDDAEEKWGASILGVPIRGPVAAMAEDRIEAAVFGLGDNRSRQSFDRELEVEWLTLVHPAAWVHPSVLLGPGTVVFAGAVIQPDCSLGRHVIVNTGATIDHDCSIGDYAHVAPGAHLAGSVRIGEGGFIGIGAAASPGRRIGPWAIVGAGGVVVHDVPEDATAVGIPARVRDRHGGEN